MGTLTPVPDILAVLHKLEESLVAHMSRDLSGFRLEMNGRFDAVEVRLDRLEIAYQMRGLEARLDEK